MIIIEKIKVKITKKNIEHYKNMGYDNIKSCDIIEIPSNHLIKGSKKIIKAKCDICGEIYNKPYNDYYISISNQDFYSCKNCKHVKLKKTMLKKYGVEHALQNKDSKEKFNNTMLERYGVENSSHCQEIKNKIKKTIQKKYGVDYITQTKDFIEKSQETKLKKYNNKNNYNKICETKKEKYGDKNFNNEEKRKITNLEKYGVKNVSQNDEIKKKKIDTCSNNYGVDYPTQSKTIKNKIIKVNNDKYGVDYPISLEETKNKVFNTNVKNGRWLSYDERTDFQNYTLQVYKFTRLNKQKLFEIWDGYDYYSKDYIKNNLQLDSNNREYPTIDHKISIQYGFKNNILPIIISEIDNLCITTRSNNSKKKEKLYLNI